MNEWRQQYLGTDWLGKLILMIAAAATWPRHVSVVWPATTYDRHSQFTLSWWLRKHWLMSDHYSVLITIKSTDPLSSWVITTRLRLNLLLLDHHVSLLGPAVQLIREKPIHLLCSGDKEERCRASSVSTVDRRRTTCGGCMQNVLLPLMRIETF